MHFIELIDFGHKKVGKYTHMHLFFKRIFPYIFISKCILFKRYIPVCRMRCTAALDKCVFKAD